MMTRQDPWQPFKADPSFGTFVKCRLDEYQRLGTGSDGVAGNHTYLVTGARYDERTQETYLTLRNPWGNNLREGNPAESNPAAQIEVKLGDLIRDDTRSLNRFEIGALPTQQRGLFDAIHGQIGTRASEGAIALAAVQASRDGIHSAGQMHSAGMTDDGKLWVAGNTPGFRIMVDTTAALPPRDESIGQLAQEAQRLQSPSPRGEAPAIQRA